MTTTDIDPNDPYLYPISNSSYYSSLQRLFFGLELYRNQGAAK
jgi:hypothetical protein